MTQQERIIQKAEKDIAYIGHDNNRSWGKSFRAGFEGAVPYTLENLWIPSSELLPEPGNNVIAWREKWGVCVAKYDGKSWWWQDGFAISDNKKGQTVYSSQVLVNDIVCWMPIPKLPVSEKKI